MNIEVYMKYIILSLLLVIGMQPCFADTKNLAPIKINLSDDMKEIFKKESEGTYMYIYHSPNIQLKIVAIDKAPDTGAENDAWQTVKLGEQIALWREGTQQPLDKLTKALEQTPKSEQIGIYTFKTVDFNFEHEDIKFMNAVRDHATYMFTIISIAKDPKQRKEDIKKFVEQLSKAELKPLPI